ncbi:MAG TPA: carbon-nitrogen hydrolase family protein [Solimonas sp.]
MTRTASGRVAAVQLNSGADLAANLAAARVGLEAAAAQGARLAALPENFAFMGAHETDKLAHAEPMNRGPIQEFLARCARELGLWIVGGTLPMAIENDPRRVAAACLVYDDQGRVQARYDKIHLFDIEVPDGSGERYRESASIAPGALQAVVVDTPCGRLGLSVCYDLRFPELYRQLARAGAQLLCVPAAFTERTGRAHWEILLRARAVENLCAVIAPGQTGTHPGERRTWGHSAIVQPWGEWQDAGTDAPTATVAALDLDAQAELRARFPVLDHRRLS